jgi:hypothetical protein
MDARAGKMHHQRMRGEAASFQVRLRLSVIPWLFRSDERVGSRGMSLDRCHPYGYNLDHFCMDRGLRGRRQWRIPPSLQPRSQGFWFSVRSMSR